ncbi:sulfotransferase [Ideonella azotifigens]|uniref:Sulfotransferase n=1 Tax=Ideonella azotifigens TaxID=513160 RepID=A0ABP3UVG4_9BURK|nr:sulfotransferase [Ideonella azotifigens]
MRTLQDIRAWAVHAQPVFICGLERSGTSILQVSFSRHPQLFPVKDVYETFIFANPRSALEVRAPAMTKAYLQGDEHAKRFRELCAGLRVGNAELSEADIIRAFFWYCAHQVYPGRQPLEKTPSHVRRLARMLEIFPRARVIVCTRDPVDVVASYRKRLKKEQSLGRSRDEWGWLDRTAEQLLAHFHTVSEHISAARQRWPEQVFVAPYAWITNDPETAMRRLCEFAGLPFVDAVLKPQEVPDRKVDEMLSRPISKRASESDQFVDAQTQAMIRQQMAKQMPLWDTPGTSTGIAAPGAIIAGGG